MQQHLLQLWQTKALKSRKQTHRNRLENVTSAWADETVQSNRYCFEINGSGTKTSVLEKFNLMFFSLVKLKSVNVDTSHLKYLKRLHFFFYVFESQSYTVRRRGREISHGLLPSPDSCNGQG